MATWLRLLMGVLFLAACGSDSAEDSCARAQKILNACGVPGNQFPTCDGDKLAYAKCVVDHESAVCSGLAKGSDLTNEFNKCVSTLTKP